MTKTETGKILMTLKAVWSNEDISPEKIEAYHWLLGDFPFDQVVAAVRVYMTQGTFFPKPAEILALIATAEQPRVSGAQAWEIVTKQIRRHGFVGFASCDFEHAVILDAVEAVGWRRLCLDDDEKGFIRREFMVAFDAALHRGRHDVQLGAALLQGNRAALPEGGL